MELQKNVILCKLAFPSYLMRPVVKISMQLSGFPLPIIDTPKICEHECVTEINACVTNNSTNDLLKN